MKMLRHSVIVGKRECYTVYDNYALCDCAIVEVVSSVDDNVFTNIHHIGLNTLAQECEMVKVAIGLAFKVALFFLWEDIKNCLSAASVLALLHVSIKHEDNLVDSASPAYSLEFFDVCASAFNIYGDDDDDKEEEDDADKDDEDEEEEDEIHDENDEEEL